MSDDDESSKKIGIYLKGFCEWVDTVGHVLTCLIFLLYGNGWRYKEESNTNQIT